MMENFNSRWYCFGEGVHPKKPGTPTKQYCYNENMKHLLKIILLISFSFLPTTIFAEDTLIVDIPNKKIGDVDMKEGIAQIADLIGTNRVKKEVEYLEEDPSDLYVIDFDGHEIYYHWNGFSFTDTYFQTGKGLRVGAKVSDFDREYGLGQFLLSEDGFVVGYEANNTRFYIMPTGNCIGYEDDEFVVENRDCTASKMWISSIRNE